MTLDSTWARRFVERAADTVSENRSALVELDREIGDGDHGENMDRGFQAVLPKLDDLPAGSTPGDVLKLVATTLISTVGGAAGPLYGTFFLRLAAPLAATTDAGPLELAQALRAGVEGVVARGKAEVGDKTMYDALAPAVAAYRVTRLSASNLGPRTVSGSRSEVVAARWGVIRVSVTGCPFWPIIIWRPR